MLSISLRRALPGSKGSTTQVQARLMSSRNLSDRYNRLAAALRKPQTSSILAPLNMDNSLTQVAAASAGLSLPGLANPKSAEAAARLTKNSVSPLSGNQATFEGIRLPIKPVPPGPEECCMSGCAICVHDLYADALKDYKTSLRSARDALLAKPNVPPVEEWPNDLREMHERLRQKGSEEVIDELDDESLDPSVRAFMEMERKLKRKDS